jgi:hypothetical protein
MIYSGGPCSCRAGRYVRFVIPPGVPGLAPHISCRANDAERDEVAVHDLPAGAVVAIRMPGPGGA